MTQLSDHSCASSGEVRHLKQQYNEHYFENEFLYLFHLSPNNFTSQLKSGFSCQEHSDLNRRGDPRIVELRVTPLHYCTAR